MGNRAVVVFEDEDSKHGIYLHWNGGPESVLAFLQVMVDRKWTRMDYASARFTAVVSEFFDDTGDDEGLSLGIVDGPDNWERGCDNGLYRVSRKGDGFLVTRRGKRVSYAKLDAKEKAKHDSIVKLLAEIRAARVARKAVKV